jgi:hypothetical protein
MAKCSTHPILVRKSRAPRVHRGKKADISWRHRTCDPTLPWPRIAAAASSEVTFGLATRSTIAKVRCVPHSYRSAGWSSPVARQAHNLKVVGSNPTPATNFFVPGSPSTAGPFPVRLQGKPYAPNSRAASLLKIYLLKIVPVLRRSMRASSASSAYRQPAWYCRSQFTSLMTEFLEQLRIHQMWLEFPAAINHVGDCC